VLISIFVLSFVAAFCEEAAEALRDIERDL
jgi:hypothetical protein